MMRSVIGMTRTTSPQICGRSKRERGAQHKAHRNHAATTTWSEPSDIPQLGNGPPQSAAPSTIAAQRLVALPAIPSFRSALASGFSLTLRPPWDREAVQAGITLAASSGNCCSQRLPPSRWRMGDDPLGNARGAQRSSLDLFRECDPCERLCRPMVRRAG
jgi:hypothetical protein